MILLCETKFAQTKKASFRDESERGFSYKNRVLSNSSFPSHSFYVMNRMWHLFQHISIYVLNGCQGFTGPDPSTFRNENATVCLKNVEIKTTKKALLCYTQKGFKIFFSLYLSPYVCVMH